jgi:hypothetical protein
MRLQVREASKHRGAAAPVVLIVGATGLVGRHIVIEGPTWRKSCEFTFCNQARSRL